MIYGILGLLIPAIALVILALRHGARISFGTWHGPSNPKVDVAFAVTVLAITIAILLAWLR